MKKITITLFALLFVLNACTQNEVEVFNVNGVSFEMVFVKGGTFWMGAQSDYPNRQNYDSEADGDEQPVHKVTLSDYYIGKFEVTQGLWKAVMGTDIRHQRDLVDPDEDFYGEGDSYPMYYVSWNDVQLFVLELNSITGKTFSLPTEAQWEFAARGGTKSKGFKYSGSHIIDKVAWYGYYDNPQGTATDRSTYPVGQRQSNELGIYDMSGNIYEWCQDWFSENYYQNSPQTNPQGPSSGCRRVLRGGSWSHDAEICRVTDRCGGSPDYRGGNRGFRLALLP